MTSVCHIVLAMKPLNGNFTENALEYGVAGLNINACRIGTEMLPEQKSGQSKIGTLERENMVTPERMGRFPANVIVQDSEEILESFPESGTGNGKQRIGKKGGSGFGFFDDEKTKTTTGVWHNDSGSASRFFKQVKE